MPSLKSKLRLICAFAALATLALAVSCRGFFVKPTLSSLVVTPASPTIDTGTTNNTVQMSATGTFNDGSTGSASVTWSISDQSVATISTGGLVKSASTGTATITATSTQNPTITGTQSLTVTECVQTITLNPTSGTITTNTPTLPITASATLCGGGTNPNVNSIATWNSDNTSLATVSAGVVTMVAGNTTAGVVHITASIGSVTSNTATITVSP